MDVVAHNRRAWNRRVELGDRWTVPVSPAAVAAARRGEWQVVLTPVLPVPRDWFGELSGARVLCLASGGGQQAPILAAAGARVSLLDNSPAQLEQDRAVAAREALELDLQLGQMTDLARFADGSFDLVFHPVSNVFVPDVRPVWREAHRVLRAGGRLLSGFCNPVIYLFDSEREEQGELVVRHRLPYADVSAHSEQELERRLEAGEPLEWSHSLQDQIGGQLDAGFVLTGFYEDRDPGRLVDQYLPAFAATRADKPPERAGGGFW